MLKVLTQQKKQFNGKYTLLVIAIVLAVTVLFTTFLPSDAASFGIFSLVPAIFLVIYIFATQRILEALVLASLVGYIMVSKPASGDDGSWLINVFTNFTEGLTGVMMSEDIAWLIIVCGLIT